jgi:ABC transport system ATP-binding/permease protein
MSEEILKALMQLFALVVKQYGGSPADEREYVKNFLTARLSKESASLYLDLFDNHTGPLAGHKAHDGPAFPSVKDSLRILGICESIARTLTQKQRITVLIWLHEMVNAGGEFTPQRINILNTVSEVFRITSDEFSAIEQFIRDDDDSMMKNSSVVFLDFADGSFRQTERIPDSRQGTFLKILRIRSTDNYFIRYLSGDQLFLDGTPVISGSVYPLGRVSSIKVHRGPSLCFSEIRALFEGGLQQPDIALTARDISIRNRYESLSNVSFNAKGGRVTGIMETSVKGGPLLLRILSGNSEPSSGSLLVNGAGFNPEIASFVPRLDMLPDELTVFENVHLAVRKNIYGRTDDELYAITLNTLLDTGFSELKDVKAKALDLPERKKLNIALGLVSDPHVLCVDDPAEGLALHEIPMMMDFLRNIARKGKLVFILDRKPSAESFGMLDDVLILDGGHLVFSGRPADAVSYFKTMALRQDAETGECSLCGCISPEPVFSILDLRVTDESGNITRKRKVVSEDWAALFDSHSPFIPLREDGEKLSASYPRPPKRYQKRIELQLELRRKLSRLKKFLDRTS